MKNLIGARLAGDLILICFGLLSARQSLVLLRLMPAHTVRRGLIQGLPLHPLALEIAVLLVSLLFMLIVAARVGYIPVGGLFGCVQVGVWLIFIILLPHAAGNLAPGISMQDLVFSPIRFGLAFLAYRLAIER